MTNSRLHRLNVIGTVLLPNIKRRLLPVRFEFMMYKPPDSFRAVTQGLTRAL